MWLYRVTENWLKGRRFYRWLNTEPVPVASDEERAEWAQYLACDKDARVNTGEVTELLLRELKYLIDTKTKLIKGTDDKASMQVTILGGGLGIISIVGATQSAMVLAGNPLILGLAALLIVAGAILDLGCLARGFRYTSQLPRIDVYNSPAILDSRRMLGRVGTSIVEGYLVYSNALTALTARKSRLLKVATITLSLGVLLLVSNAAWADTHAQKPNSNANCRFSSESINCILSP
jgi:hypothetical protein